MKKRIKQFNKYFYLITKTIGFSKIKNIDSTESQHFFLLFKDNQQRRVEINSLDLYLFRSNKNSLYGNGFCLFKKSSKEIYKLLTK